MSRRPTSRQLQRSRIRWGLGTLSLFAVAVYLTFGGGLPFRGGYDVEAVFSSANEVKKGSPVRIAGVNVGKVREVRRGPGTTAIVTMRLTDAGRPLHRDATAKVRPRLFLEGNFFVDLSPGTSQAPELEDGDTIPLAQTAIPVQFDQVLTALQADERRALQDLVGELDVALDGGGAEAIRRSFGPSEGAFLNFARLSQEARGTAPRDLSRLITVGAAVVGALEPRRAELAQLVERFDRTLGAFADRARPLRASLRGLDRVARGAYPALGDLNAALPPTRRLAHDVRPLVRRAPKTLDLALPLLQELDRLVGPDELPPLLDDARPTLRSLSVLTPQLRQLLGKVDPVARCVTRNALPVLNAKLDDDALSSDRTVLQEFLAANTGLASASQNFDGNGTAVRYGASFGEQTLSLGTAASATQLYQLLDAPLLGSRPARPARKPPFRPDVPCATQDPPNLDAKVQPIAGTARRNDAPRLTAAAVRKILRGEAAK